MVVARDQLRPPPAYRRSITARELGDSGMGGQTDKSCSAI